MKICKHFDECGGCRFQDISYQKQLKDKENKAGSLLSSSGLGGELKAINNSSCWYYRNKMEFTFADQQGIVCGLYSKKEKRKVVDIEECLIFSPDTGDILKTIKEFVKERNYSVYNKYSHEGFLRYLIIREAKFTNEIMVGIVTSSADTLDKEEFVRSLISLKLDSAVKSIYWIINDSLSDAVVFDKKMLLHGEPFIQEELGDIAFRIDIDSFFQVHPCMAADFYNKIKGYAGLSGTQRVLDIFCGVGSIGMFLASGAKFVWGVEISKEIVEMAWKNAKINNIENISFLVSDARKFLNTQGLYYRDIDVLTINPPRCGLSNKIIRAILRLNPKVILYSSCNPNALFRDLGVLNGSYHLDFIEPFDFFPHTPHLECLSLLRRN